MKKERQFFFSVEEMILKFQFEIVTRNPIQLSNVYFRKYFTISSYTYDKDV